MEDIFKILLVTGILIYGFVKQLRKETPEQPAFPYPEMPDSDIPPMPEGIPIPEDIPMQQDSHPEPAQETVIAPHKQSGSTPAHKKSRKYQPIQESKQTTADLSANEHNETTDYSIHSVEEARRAIIWSEILQRKY